MEGKTSGEETSLSPAVSGASQYPSDHHNDWCRTQGTETALQVSQHASRSSCANTVFHVTGEVLVVDYKTWQRRICK